MLEENFITSMIKSDGNLLGFVDRPVSAALAVFTLLVWILSGWFALKRRMARH
jgi:TctA family transporter